MQITRLYAKNFLSYETLDLPLADCGLVLIEGENQDTGGSNGAGKSAIFEALVWGLFGVTNRGLKADEVVRRDESRQLVNDTMVCVEIDVDGKHVQVFRHRNHSKFKNKMLLFIDGNEVTMGSDKETQERLNSLMQIDKEAFVSAVMFPQGAEGFASLTDSGQKAILDRILGMERFSEAQHRVRDKLKQLATAATRAETTVAAKKKTIADLETQIKDTGSRITAWEADHAAKKIAINEAMKKLEAEKPVIDTELETKTSSLKAALDQANQQQLAAEFQVAVREAADAGKRLEQARGRANGLATATVPLRPEPVKPSSDLATASHNAGQWDNLNYQYHGQRSSINGRIASLQSQLQQVEDSCPTCGQPLPGDVGDQTRRKLQAQIDELKQQLPELDRKIDEAAANFQAWQAEKTKAQDYENWLRERASQESSAKQLEQALQEANDLAIAVVPLEVKAERLRKEHDRVVAMAREYQEASMLLNVQQASLNNWETKSAQFQGALSTLEQEKNPYPEMQARQRQQLAQTKADIGRAEAIQDALHKEIRYLSFWDAGFGHAGVKSLLLDTVVPFLTSRAGEYLSLLTNDSATINFSTQTTLSTGDTRDKFQVDVNYLYGGDSYESVSGGERRRVDLAALFALGDLAASRSLAPIRLRLLDEPFDNLDTLGSEQVVQILREMILPSAGTVLVMTHDDNLKALIEKRITVVKQDGISKICVV